MYTIFNNKEKKVLNLSVFSTLNFNRYLFRKKRLTSLIQVATEKPHLEKKTNVRPNNVAPLWWKIC